MTQEQLLVRMGRARGRGWLCVVMALVAAAVVACGDDDATGEPTDDTGTAGADTAGASGGDGTSGTADDTSGTSGTEDDTSGTSGTSGADTSGTSGADTSGGDTSGVVVPPLREPTAEEASACAALGQAVCELARGCPALGGDQLDLGICLRAVNEQCVLGAVLPGSNQSVAVITTCAQTLPLLTCDDVEDITTFEALCSIPSGDRPNGARCALHVQCQILNCNVTSEGFPCGTCGLKPPPGAQGEVCDPFTGECQAGLVCEPVNETSGTCQPPPPPKEAGAACNWGDVCVEGYTCSAELFPPAPGTCDPTPPPIEEGQPCEILSTCAEGLVCNASFLAPGVCVATVPAGGACTSGGAPCARGYTCQGGTCQAQGAVGQGGECLSLDFGLLPCGAGLYCAFLSGTCEPMAGLGEACNPFFGPECARGQCSEAGICELPAYGACQ